MSNNATNPDKFKNRERKESKEHDHKVEHHKQKHVESVDEHGNIIPHKDHSHTNSHPELSHEKVRKPRTEKK